MPNQQPKFETIDKAISWGKEKTKLSSDFVQKLRAYSAHLCKITKEIAEKNNFPIFDVILAGSVSRSTYLPWSIDIDLFARLIEPEKSDLKSFTSLVLPEVAKVEKTEVEFRYAENPYGHLSCTLLGEKIGVDIVATVYTSKEELQSALKISGMARTPFHNDFLQNHIKELEDHVRVLKWWFKRKKIYGQFGFTGFLTEFLVGYYGSFREVLEASKEIVSSRIDLEGRKTSELEKTFEGDQLIVVDPIDPNRNAAAGIQGIIGEYKLKRFLSEARRSLEQPKVMFEKSNPKQTYFEIKSSFSPTPQNEEEEGSRLARLAGYLRGVLKENIEFLDLFLLKNPSRLLIEPNRFQLVPRTIRGPPEQLTSAVEKFKSRHKDYFIRENRLYAKIPPKYDTVEELIRKMMNDQKWLVSPILIVQKPTLDDSKFN